MRGRDRIALAACAVSVGFTALALGGAVRWAVVVGSLGAVGAAIPYVTSRRSAVTSSPLLLLLAIAIGLTALQLVPLPAALAHLVAGPKLELVTENAAALGTAPPSLVMASYDPPATLVELCKLVGYTALAFAALRIASQRQGRRALAMVVVVAASAVAVVTIGHELVGARAVYGLVTPPARHPLLSPILNDNHFASLMTLAVPVALGLAATCRRLQRMLWLAAALTCTAVGLLISSRGGAIGLAIGVVVASTIMLLQRRAATSGPRPRGNALPAIVISACVVVLLVVFAAGKVTDELNRTSLDELTTSEHWKYQSWGYALEMLQEHRLLGIGRGAFEPAFTRWAPVGDAAYSHVENSYLQVVLDWGIPGALAMIVAAALLVVPAVRRWRETPLEAGVIGALVALAAHDVVDFSIELPIVAMATILLAVILVPGRFDKGALPAARRRRIRGGLLVAAAACCVVSALPLGRLAHAAAADVTGSSEERLARALATVDRHPADYLAMGRAAQALMELGDPRALSVIARALFLNPKHSGLHRLAATMLLRAHQPSQAAGELALAVQFAPYLMLNDLVREIAASFPDPRDAARALPLDPAVAEKIAGALRSHTEIAFEYTRRLALINPRDPRAQLLYARAAIATGRGEVALVAARAAFRLRPDTASAIAVATAQSLAHDAAGAIATLRHALAIGGAMSPSEHVDVLTTIADLEIASGAFGAAAATLEELAQLVTDRSGQIRLHQRRAALHDHLGEPNLAKWERSEAARIEANGGS